MSDYGDLISDAMAAVLAHQTWTGERDVLLGDYQGNIIAANAPYPRSVYWHNQGSEIHEVGTAVLSSDSNILYQENTSYKTNPPMITIGYPPRSKILTVKGTSSSIHALQAQGTTSQLEQYMLRLGNPSLYNVVDWRVSPNNPTSDAVVVSAGRYVQPGAPGILQSFSGGSISLTTTISALSSGKHQMGVVYFDLFTQAIGIATSASVSAVSSLPSRTELNASTLASIQLLQHQPALGVLYLYYGQTSITESDMYRTLETRWAMTSNEDASPPRLYMHGRYY